MKVERSTTTRRRMCGGQFGVELADDALDTVGHFDRVGAGLLDDVEGQSRAVVDERGAAALLDAVHDPRHFGEIDGPAVADGDDQVLELVHRAELAGHAHQRLAPALLQLAGGKVQVLALERSGHLGVGQAEGFQLLVVHEDLDLAAGQSDQLHLAHAGHGLQPLLHRPSRPARRAS